MKVHTYIRGGPFDFWGGGGVRKLYLNNLFIFCQVGNFFFILPAVKNKFFFSFVPKMKQFFSTYFCEHMGHAVSFDDNMRSPEIIRVCGSY